MQFRCRADAEAEVVHVRCRAVVHSSNRGGAEAEQVLNWQSGAEVLSRCRSADVQRCRGAEVLSRCRGAEVQRCRVTEMQRFRDTGDFA